MDRPNEKLRSGYTTGACAAAAAKGALLALVYQQIFDEVAIRLPQGQQVRFRLHTCSSTPEEGRSSVIKDAGDDPDVTDKAEICARVGWCDTPGVSFRRGQGVGLVTKMGLPVPPGEPAINPVPRRMIAEAVQEVLDSESEEWGARSEENKHPPHSSLPTPHFPPGVSVEISVPSGEEIAKKTFNPRLGIVGGISILGTTGIVTPYSTAAWLASVVQSIDVAAAQGCRHLVLTVGARGERTARQLFDLPEDAFIQIGPFFADALRHCHRAGIARVSLTAMIGKLAKFAAGNESVHSTTSSQDFDFLARLARESTDRRDAGPTDLLARIRTANTAQEVAEMIAAAGQVSFFTRLCEQAWTFARGLVGDTMAVEIVLTGVASEVLGRYPKN
ncbi:MAG TPA: cobalt-precorrin-5B (C(1))-methyltransferase [Gemmataceae bacterium]|nr:cobalt-precorrin-5B (C(1))-methyltransferase [Gemmataceae bacterium]